MCRKAKRIVGFSQKKRKEKRVEQSVLIRGVPDIIRSTGLIKFDRSKNNGLGLRGRLRWEGAGEVGCSVEVIEADQVTVVVAWTGVVE